jgi:hypothetical protein
VSRYNEIIINEYAFFFKIFIYFHNPEFYTFYNIIILCYNNENFVILYRNNNKRFTNVPRNVNFYWLGSRRTIRTSLTGPCVHQNRRNRFHYGVAPLPWVLLISPDFRRWNTQTAGAKRKPQRSCTGTCLSAFCKRIIKYKILLKIAIMIYNVLTRFSRNHFRIILILRLLRFR